MSDLNLNSVFNKMQEGVGSTETGLQNAMKGDLTSTSGLMNLQAEMQKWSLATSAQSNVVKTIGEALKSTVGNIR